MSTYAIGDIQGCYRPFRCLLDKIEFDPARDTLWIAGDLVNRGPDSLAVMRYLFNIRDSVVCVLGNHDLHLLSVATVGARAGKQDTLEALLAAPDRDILLHWLRHQKIMHHDPASGFTMVHAGIPPQWDIPQALTQARLLEEALRADNYRDYLQQMYGNEPACWHPSLTGADALRVITNYFTRMRFCRADGTLDLITKESAGAAPAGFLPWFAHPHRKTAGELIIFGHWAALEGKVDEPGIHALDTGCVWGGHLTAMRLEDRQRFSCDCAP